MDERIPIIEIEKWLGRLCFEFRAGLVAPKKVAKSSDVA